MHRLIRAAGVLVAAIGLSLPASAMAATPQADHCVLNVETGDMSCYATLSEAQQSRTAAVEYHLGMWFDWINHNPGGGTLEFRGPRQCTGPTTDIDYYDRDLRDGYWNNRVSSLTTANRCDFKLYDGLNFTGYMGTFDYSRNLGAASNRTSSYIIT